MNQKEKKSINTVSAFSFFLTSKIKNKNIFPHLAFAYWVPDAIPNINFSLPKLLNIAPNDLDKSEGRKERGEAGVRACHENCTKQ